MRLKFTYYLTTFLYLIIGLTSIYFFYNSLLQDNPALSLITALIVFVAFDNVFCKSRKKNYYIR
ncbi:MAG TPA: hypothetical protein VJB94_00620 [Candidatus Nanoarchaeia archaeon]|nr:hypothetical protein [Candidatus Nanoarchaeia archaeon]